MPIDLSQDISAQLRHRIETLYEPPVYAKTAELSGDYMQSLPAHVFADPRARTFACVDKASAWWAAAYFAEQTADYTEKQASAIRARLLDAARYYNNLEDVQQIFERQDKLAAYSLEALPDSDFAVVYEVPGQQKQRFLPLRTTDELCKAADWLLTQRDDLQYTDRRKLAEKLLDKAEDQHAVLPAEQYRTLVKMAGYGTAPVDEIADAFKQRERLAYSHGNRELGEQLHKTAAMVRDTPGVPDQERCMQYAETLDAIDRALGIKYNDEIQRPEDIVFCVTEKVADEVAQTYVTLQNGSVYSRPDLEKISADDVKNWLGDDMLASVTNGDGLLVDREALANVAATLPRPDADMFDGLARAVGIQKRASVTPPADPPVSLLSKEAAAQYTPPSREALLKRVAQLLG